MDFGIVLENNNKCVASRASCKRLDVYHKRQSNKYSYTCTCNWNSLNNMKQENIYLAKRCGTNAIGLLMLKNCMLSRNIFSSILYTDRVATVVSVDSFTNETFLVGILTIRNYSAIFVEK